MADKVSRGQVMGCMCVGRGRNGSIKDLGSYSRSNENPFKCLSRGMTCSELHFGNITRLPYEEWIVGHKNKCRRSSNEATAGDQIRDNDSLDQGGGSGDRDEDEGDRFKKN